MIFSATLRRYALFALSLSLALTLTATPGGAIEGQGSPAYHHKLGVEHHNRRNLDEASREYARALKLDPPRNPTPDELAIARRFAPRIHVTPSEFFPLKDFAVILHPDRPLIAYHFFWEDDIDFPEDNDPCDHELMWVEHADQGRRLKAIWTYFHGRILLGGEAARRDAAEHGGRPRIEVQWGKHGSMPIEWDALPITVSEGDVEGKYLPPPNERLTLKQYNEATYKKLSTEGRRLLDHPLGRRLGWPERFTGRWTDFVDFSRRVEPLEIFERTKMVKVSRWNSATIDQHFLAYNFRPKTEWPDER
jgi:hypothetical protein